MENHTLTDDELRAEYRRANRMAALANNAGEVDAVTVFEATARAIEVEMLDRKITP